MNSLETAKFIAHVIDEKIGEDIKVIKVDDFTVITDYFVVATATSGAHVKALRDEVEMKMSEKGLEPKHKETEAENWIVLDYTDVIVHIFDKETREQYSLDKLWADATLIEFE